MALLQQGIDSQAVPLVIRLLDGPNANTEIKLEGRALPYWGINYKGNQRSKLTWYPGNPVATQQILGPTDEPTVINGIWKDRFLGNGVGRQLADTFDDIRRAGTSVEVSWGDSATAFVLDTEIVTRNPIVRRGIIKNFEHRYDRVQDVVWTMEFEWRGRDEPTQSPLTSAGAQSSREAYGEMADSLINLLESVEAAVSGPFTLLSGIDQQARQTLDEVTESLNRTVDFFNGTLRSARSIADLPREVLERGRSLAKAASESLTLLKNTLLDNFSSVGVIGGRDEGLGLLDQRDGLFDLLDASDSSQQLSNQTEASLAGLIEPDIIDEVDVVPGSDLRDVARQYYGDPDLWTIIANFNGLDSSRVPDKPNGVHADPVRALRIPRRPEGTLSKLSQGVC